MKEYMPKTHIKIKYQEDQQLFYQSSTRGCIELHKTGRMAPLNLGDHTQCLKKASAINLIKAKRTAYFLMRIPLCI